MRRIIFAVVVLSAAGAQPAWAQESLKGVLSFLLTNRSIPTGDFAHDEQAASATRDAITGLLLSELATLPMSSPASGFTYRLEPGLGANVRSTDSFGPFFLDRSLTIGKGQVSLGYTFSQTTFDSIDGRSLRTGTLVAVASRFAGDAEPFDAESLTLRIRARTLLLSGQVGITDRLDVSAALPMTRLDLGGERVDTYRGTAFLQATAVASASGIGDLTLRGKYNLLRRGGSGVAVGAEARFGTGDSENLLGGGEDVFIPRLIASLERDRVSVHGSLGLALSRRPREIDFGGAITMAASARVTVVGECFGRRLASGGRLNLVVEPQPGLVGVETIRLTGTEQSTTRLLVAAGVRWNIASRVMLSSSVHRPLTTAGLNARWVASVSLDYAFGG